jgi:hypothetical protein
MMWWIYLIGVANNVSALAFVALAGSLGYTASYFAVRIEPDNVPNFLKHKYPFVILAISALLAVFVPSSKTLAAMYVLPKIAENQEIKTEAHEILDLAKAWLKKESR